MPGSDGRYRHPSIERRAIVWDRCAGTCEYCGKDMHPFWDFVLDHRVPLCAGGRDAIENLVGACYECNVNKLKTHDIPARTKTKDRGRKATVNEMRADIMRWQRRIEAIVESARRAELARDDGD